MAHLKKKILNLALGEFTALCTFIFVRRLFDLGQASHLSFLYLIFILLQGSGYWFYRYRLLRKKEHYTKNVVRIFKILKQINLIILVILGLSILFYKNNNQDLIIAIGLYIFGIIEYINYYHYRLSYGKSGFNIKMLMRTGLKKSSINKMLNEY